MDRICELNDLVRLDAPVTSSVDPRWLRKQKQETAAPTPSTPKSRRRANTGDRFIPSQSGMDLERSHRNLTFNENATPASLHSSPAKEHYKSTIAESLLGGDSGKVLAFKAKAPAPKDGYQNSLRVLYSQNAQKDVQKSYRQIPQTACRVLDAPELLDDYYLNLLDWSTKNILAIALGQSVYLWNAATSEINELCTVSEPDNYISSLSWIKEGTHLAIGTANADTQLWDVQSGKHLRSMNGHMSRVSALSWNSHVLTSGSRDASIINHDVRQREHAVNVWTGHTQEICGLEWSPDGTQLASGANDNLMNIWSVNTTDDKPRFTMDQHCAAVRALAWCPWQSNLLASGGGTADRTIKFWNTSSGGLLNSIDAASQVCSLKWSRHHREIVSSHGFSKNSLCVWKYPSMVKIAELAGHEARVLHLAVSPDGETVVSAGGDESLRFWKIFEKSAPVKSASTTAASSRSLVGMNIR